MAEDLQIRRCWFHAGRLAHYDVPKRRQAQIALRTLRVTSRALLGVILKGTLEVG